MLSGTSPHERLILCPPGQMAALPVPHRSASVDAVATLAAMEALRAKNAHLVPFTEPGLVADEILALLR